jgi:membrane protease YdiL (CAAX protease family)
VSARDRLRSAAVGFAVSAVLALHPGVWKWANKGQRKALKRPVWRRVARAMLGGVLLALVFSYFEYSSERLKEEDPELWARMHADAEARDA